MRARAIRLLAIVLTALLAAVQGTGRAAEPFTIDAIFSLTGGGAFLGKASAQGLEQLEKMVNQSGGINGQPIHFGVQDDQTHPAVAVHLLNGLLAHNPAVVIGSSLVASCSAMAPLIQNGPVMYCLSSGVHPPAGSYMFSAFFNTDDLIASSARYFRQRGWTKVATITSTDAWDGRYRFEDSRSSVDRKPDVRTDARLRGLPPQRRNVLRRRPVHRARKRDGPRSRSIRNAVWD